MACGCRARCRSRSWKSGSSRCSGSSGRRPSPSPLVWRRHLADDGPNKHIGESAMVAALRVVLAAAWLLSGVVASAAQNYPSKPVRIVVGFPAGGPTDAIARIVAQKLTDNLGHQFFVENIGGAGGNTAAG